MSTTRLMISLVLASCPMPAQAQIPQFVISTIAGAPALPATPVQALSVSIGSPVGLATDAVGNVYFTTSFQTAGGNYDVLLRVDQSSLLTRLAGYSAGYSGDGGPAAAAQLNGVGGVVVDRSGNTYITDSSDNRVRRIAQDGTITTIAGTGDGVGGSRSSGDGGPALNAGLSSPWLLAIDAAGNLYVGENARIRKISTDGTITTVAGSGVYGYTGDGGPATSAQIGLIGGLAVDQAGNLYISDSYFLDDDYNPTYSRVRMVSSDGIIRTIAGSGSPGYSGDGDLAANAQLQTPGALAIDTAGNLYMVDGSCCFSTVSGRAGARVRKISTDGIIATIAGNGGFGYSGDGGPAASATFGYVSGLATDSAGNVYVADGSRIRKISQAGIITTIAGDASPSGGDAFDDGGPAKAAVLGGPTGVAVDTAGALYISETFNNRLRKVSSDGVISTVAVAGGFYAPSGLAIDPAGNLYIAESNAGRISRISPDRVRTIVAGSVQAVQPDNSGDGGPAVAAKLWWPKDVALDSSGNLYIADTGNNRIRMVSPAGIITTIAGAGAPGYGGAGYSGDGGPAVRAGLYFPSGIAVDRAGNLFIADTNNFRVRKISPSGTITTVAGNGVRGSSGDGGNAVNAQLSSPTGLKLDSAGNLYIADGASVRLVSTLGIITTVAGTGVLGFSGDGGPATSAQLGAWGLAFDGIGNLYVADPWGGNIRQLMPGGK